MPSTANHQVPSTANHPSTFHCQPSKCRPLPTIQVPSTANHPSTFHCQPPKCLPLPTTQVPSTASHPSAFHCQPPKYLPLPTIQVPSTANHPSTFHCQPSKCRPLQTIQVPTTANHPSTFHCQPPKCLPLSTTQVPSTANHPRTFHCQPPKNLPLPTTQEPSTVNHPRTFHCQPPKNLPLSTTQVPSTANHPRTFHCQPPKNLPLSTTQEPSTVNHPRTFHCQPPKNLPLSTTQVPSTANHPSAFHCQPPKCLPLPTIQVPSTACWQVDFKTLVCAIMTEGTPHLFLLLLLLLLLLTKAGGNHSAANSTHHHPTRSRRTPEHPHTHLTTPELIQVRGYPAEVHHVTTDDGYILEMHRIPHGRNGRRRSSNGEPRVVFVMHGVLFSSAGFVLNDPDQALAFILADAGYDVWLGNARGTSYGRRHVSLSPSQPEFWDFSFNELARYDVPAMLRYVRKTTGAAQVDYVGHSLGASIFFAVVNYHPYINSWVRVVAAMAPAAHIRGRHVPMSLLSPFGSVIDEQLTRLGKLELFPSTYKSMAASSALCGERTFTSLLCIIFYFSIAGGINSVYLDKEYLPVIFSHWPDGIGLHLFVHLLQVHRSGEFQAFDFGEARNSAVYGTPHPPEFTLNAVTVPVGVFWSENDWVADPQGIHQTVAELPQVVLDYRVPLSDFNHADFVLAENAAHLVYRQVLQLLDRYGD
nr:gastric triacylglycerol lipase-like [Procambarus clarkii]